jgi:hypothetical protein
MKWRKKQIEANEGRIDVWRSDCGSYLIVQNINHGKIGPNDSAGGWWFAVCRIDEKGEETDIGEAPTLRIAKYVAEDDAEDLRCEQST